jgi:hypothetical protein
VTLNLSSSQPTATVRITNESGHKLPTGYAEGRRMWLTVRGFDAAGSQVYISGEYDPATGILADAPDTNLSPGAPALGGYWRVTKVTAQRMVSRYNL